MPISEKLPYRSDIDGLRGIAVLAIVLFHAGFGCSGGYIGVDVFFVISGFLITSLIWKDLENGRFGFAQFWERRTRRIVPALVVVTVAVLAAGWFLLLPLDFKNLGKASAAQTVFAANIHYWRDAGYFSSAADEKPLLHTWSLAVEEQFYILVPLLLWALFRFANRHSRAVTISVLAAGFALSLGASVYAVSRYPMATFYLLPTRAWELLLGSLVALVSPSFSLARRRSLRELFATSGLVLILVPLFFYRRETPFPGLAALPPCLGAALLIWANTPTVVGSLLSTRPIVFVGLISYSLYLWHWPFLAFCRYQTLGQPSPGYRAAMLALGLLFAVLSWQYVETPFRQRKLAASRKSMFTFAGLGLAIVFACGLLCLKMQGFPQRLPAQAVEFAGAASDSFFSDETTIQSIRDGKLIRLGVSGSNSAPAVFVWGDSHGRSALPALDAFLKEKNLAGEAAVHNSTAPVLGWFYPSPFGLNRGATAYNQAIFSYIERHKIQDVILIARWQAYIQGNEFMKSKKAERLKPVLLLSMVKRLAAIGSRPWIMLDVPIQNFDVPKTLARSVLFGTDTDSLCARPTPLSDFDAIDPQTIAAIKAAGGNILDPKPQFLDPSRQHYIAQLNGVALYRDDQHLTQQGAKLMLLPFFRHAWTLQKQ